MSHALSPCFFDDLKTGMLNPFLERVKADSSLCLELRGNSINIYYRGGSLLKLEQRKRGYRASFNYGHFGKLPQPLHRPPTKITGPGDVSAWLAAWPLLKCAMDRSPKLDEEREVQQFIVRDNNFRGQANSTDYYICDIEYASASGRFDIIAVHWPSTGLDRKKQHHRRLVVAEVKHGDGALKNSSGLNKHIEDINGHLASRSKLDALKTEMLAVFNQKRELGLIKCKKPLVAFSEEPPILLLVLANHDPGSTKLGKLLRSLPPSPHAEVRIASSCLLGYGFYDPAILSVNNALDRFGSCI